MLNWKEGFVGGVTKKSIHINRNGNYEMPKAFTIENHWSYADFLSVASERLEMVPSAKLSFNSLGA
jgi:hypothetical protein